MKRKAFLLFITLAPVIAAGQSWYPVGTGVSDFVDEMRVWNNKLYLSGAFTNAGGTPAARIACWDGSKYDSLQSGTWGVAECFTEYSNKLFAGGNFMNADAIPYTKTIACWDGNSWSSVTDDVQTFTATINAMIVYNGDLYVGGNVTRIDSVNVNRIARWNGTSWSDVGGGVAGSIGKIYSMAVYNNRLYVGGLFTSAGGVPAYYIARWNGTQWDSVGSGMNGSVGAMVVDTMRNRLYVAGGFSTAGGVQVNGFAQWNDTAWAAMGNDPVPGGKALVMYHNELYSGGSGTGITAAGDTLRNIAKWNGWQWKSVGKGTNWSVEALAVYNDTLFAGGSFDTAGTVAANYIAKWYSPPDSTLGLPAQQKQNTGLHIYPNPSSGQCVVECESPAGSQAALIIYDAAGKPVKKLSLNDGKNRVEVNTNGWKPGTYFFHLQVNGSATQARQFMLIK
jgi:trimeric autotransporter adhesin